MKVRTQETIPKASRIFTDREEPRSAFWQNYELIRQEISQGESNIHVLNYYGIGGIGKSRLLRQLATEMEEKLSQPRYVYFDFNVAQERRAVLMALKNKLAEAYKFQFPMFDLAAYVYARSIGEDPDSPEIKKLTESSPLLSLLLSVTETIPVVGVAAKVLSLADQGIAVLRNHLNQRDLIKLDSLTAEELYEQLPCFFARDMAQNLANADQPLVLFLDTYERLVNEMVSVGAPLNHDLWLRDRNGAVQNTPKVLWVIAGREKLKWERFDPDWDEALDTHILGNLSPTDSDRFLSAAGVGGVQLRRGVYDLTNGTPVYLDLCIDQYLRLIQQGAVPDISMFGDNTYDLIERFVRYMDGSLKDIVYVLACMEQWTDATLSCIAGQVLPNFSLTTYEKVKEFSFVIQSDDHTFNIHQTVGEVLVAHCPEGVKNHIVACAMDHFSSRLKAGSDLSSEFVSDLRYVMHFGLMQHSDDEELLKFYKDQISEHVVALAEAGRFAEANAVFDLFWFRAEENQQSLLYAWALWNKSYLLTLIGELTQSEILAAKAVERFTDLLGPNHPDTLNAAASHASCLADLGKYSEVVPFYKELLQKYETVFSDHENALSAKKELSRALFYLEEYEEAGVLQEQLLAEYRKAHGEDHPDTLAVMVSLAATRSGQAKYEEALKLEEDVLTKYRTRYGEDHPKTLAAMNNMAATLSRLARTEEALSLQEGVLEQYRNLFGESHPHTLTAKSNLATTLSTLSHYEQAFALQKEVLETRQILWGEQHPETLNAMRKLSAIIEKRPDYGDLRQMYDSILLQQRGRMGDDYIDEMLINVMYSFHLVIDQKFEEATNLLELFIPMQRAIFGEDDEYYIMSLDNLADAYNYTGKEEAALELYRQLAEKARVTHGDDSPKTLDALCKVAGCLNKLSRHKEALELQKQILDQRRALAGEDHRAAILQDMKNLAGSFRELERYKEALTLDEQILEKARELYGDEALATLEAMNKIADTLVRLSRQEEAQKLREQTVPGLQKLLETDPLPKKLHATEALALTLFKMERYEESKGLWERLFSHYKENYSENHTFLHFAMFFLAETYEKLSLHKEALQLREGHLARQRRVFGDEHANTVSAMSQLANSLWKLKSYEEELPLREQILSWWEMHRGEDHPDTLAAMSSLAITLHELGRYEEASHYQRHVLETRTKVLGEDHPNTLTAMHNLAYTLSELEQHEEARTLMEQTIQKRQTVLGPEHVSTLGSVHGLAVILHGMKLYSQAREQAERSVELRRKVYGEAHPKTIKAMERLSDILKDSGCKGEQLALDEKIRQRKGDISI